MVSVTHTNATRCCQGFEDPTYLVMIEASTTFFVSHSEHLMDSILTVLIERVSMGYVTATALGLTFGFGRCRLTTPLLHAPTKCTSILTNVVDHFM